jgi:glycosyltransferase involved in cell wall biosynthesis
MDVARALKERGHDVTILTGLPNYPSGRLYPGYSLKPLTRETREGIPVLRAILFPSHSTSSLARILNYGSFMVSSVAAALLTPPCDAIYVWHPPLTVGVSAWLIGLMKGAPFVYDVQDIWPESGVWSGMLKKGFLYRVLQRLEKFVYARAARLLVVTEGARRNLVGKGVPPERVTVVSQIVDENAFGAPDPARVAAVRRELALDGRFAVMFAGNLGLVQGLETAVEAAELLTSEPRILFVLVGDGADRERLERRTRELGLTNVVFAGRRPAEDMPHFLSAADAALLSLSYSEICEYSIPLKTFAYLAAAKPVVASLQGAAADLIAKAGAGVVVPPGDARALADAVRALAGRPAGELAALGASGRAYLVAHHARAKMLAQHVDLIEAAARR